MGNIIFRCHEGDIVQFSSIYCERGESNKDSSNVAQISKPPRRRFLKACKIR